MGSFRHFALFSSACFTLGIFRAAIDTTLKTRIWNAAKAQRMRAEGRHSCLPALESAQAGRQESPPPANGYDGLWPPHQSDRIGVCTSWQTRKSAPRASGSRVRKLKEDSSKFSRNVTIIVSSRRLMRNLDGISGYYRLMPSPSF